jgi:hypothetical protein
MSWIPQVQTDGRPEWTGNLCRFATREEAEKQAINLMWRWMSVDDTRAVESDDPVNARWNADTQRMEHVADAEPTDPQPGEPSNAAT